MYLTWVADAALPDAVFTTLLGSMEDEDVVLPEVARKVADGRVDQRPGAAVHDKHPGLVAVFWRCLGDPRFRERIVVRGDGERARGGRVHSRGRISLS